MPTAQRQFSFVQTELTSVAAHPVIQAFDVVNAMTIKRLEFTYSFALLLLPVLAPVIFLHTKGEEAQVQTSDTYVEAEGPSDC